MVVKKKGVVMLDHSHNSQCHHDGAHEVDECPDCGSRSWPDYAVVTRHLWSRTKLGMGNEKRTWALHSLASRLPQIEADSVYCERCTLELDLSELWDDPAPSLSDTITEPPPPLVPPVPFCRDHVVVCPDCGSRHWSGFSVALQYFHELNRIECWGMSTARLRELAWSFAPTDEEYELCEVCTSKALQAPGTISFFTAKRRPVFEAQEVENAVETMFDGILPRAA